MIYEKFYEKLMKRGITVFGNKIKFNMWMGSHNKYLNDKPVNFITSYDGLMLVYEELMRVEKGIKN